MARANRKPKENRIRRGNSYEERSRSNKKLTRTRRSRRTRKKFSLSKLLATLSLILVLSSIIYYVYDKRISDKNKNFINAYYNEDYSNALASYNENLFYKRYNKDSETGLYKEVSIEEATIENKVTDNMEYLLIDRLMTLLKENEIDQGDFALAVQVDSDLVANVNDQVKISETYIDKLVMLMMLRDGLTKETIDLSTELAIYNSDFVNGSTSFTKEDVNKMRTLDAFIDEAISNKDPLSQIVINRYLDSLNYSKDAYIREITGSESSAQLSMVDMIKLMQAYNDNKSLLSNYFNKLLAEDDSLFMNAIYSQASSSNILDNNGQKVDMGYVNSTSPFYYSIYTDKLDDNQISLIGDLVSRTINEIELSKKIVE